jgi:hypothetical protein
MARLLPLLLLLAASAASPAGAAQPPALGRNPPTLLENQHLASELALAGKPLFYLVFDLASSRVQLKARGRTFRSWEIRSLSFWGTGVPPTPLKLEGKSALFAPHRVTIEPIPAEETAAEADSSGEISVPDTFEVEALELPDMPSSYSLSLSEGVRISVSPTARGLIARIRRLLHGAWWNATLPLRALWWRIWGKPFVAVELVLEREDARALYWAFPEGSSALIHQ